MIDTLVLAAQFVDVPVEALEFGKKRRLRKMTVDDSNRIIGIDRDLKIAANGFDRLHVAGRHIAGRSDQRERRPHMISPCVSQRFYQPHALTTRSPVAPARAQALRVSTTSLA